MGAFAEMLDSFEVGKSFGTRQLVFVLFTHFSYKSHNQGLIVSKCSKVGVKMWFKWTKYSDQTNFEPKVLYEGNQGHWNVFRIMFTWSKYLSVAAFFRPKYRNSLAMKIYKKHGHHVTCLANMADPYQVSLTYSYNLHLGIMIQISEWGWIRKRRFNTKFTPHILVLHIRFKRWFKWTHILGSNDWYNTFGVIFRIKPRYLFQTWTWTLWYNQAQKSNWLTKDWEWLYWPTEILKLWTQSDWLTHDSCTGSN